MHSWPKLTLQAAESVVSCPTLDRSNRFKRFALLIVSQSAERSFQRDNHNQVSPHKQLASTSCILSPLNVVVRSSYCNLLNLTNTFVVKSLKRTEGLGVFKSETFRECLWSDGQSAAPVPPEISHFLDELRAWSRAHSTVISPDWHDLRRKLCDFEAHSQPWQK